MGFFRAQAQDSSGGDVVPDSRRPSVLPVPLQIAVEVGRSEFAAVFAHRFTVEPWGLSFWLRVAATSVRGLNVASDNAPYLRKGADVGSPLPEELFRFGIRLADGTELSSLDDWTSQARDAQTCMIVSLSDAGDRERNYRASLRGLPPAGPIDLIVEWPAVGIAESRVQIDGAPILDAAARPRLLWPDTGDVGRGPIRAEQRSRSRDLVGMFASSGSPSWELADWQRTYVVPQARYLGQPVDGAP